MHLRTLVLFSVLSFAFGQERKITPKLNPDCEACSENTTLFYIKAEGSHDTIHQLWDFTLGTPTIIYAVASVNSSLQVLWDNDRPVKFNMSEDPSYSFAMAISDRLKVCITISLFTSVRLFYEKRTGFSPNAAPVWIGDFACYTLNFFTEKLKLYEYDDLEDIGHIDSHAPRRSYSLSALSWERRDSVLTERRAMVAMQAERFRRGRRWDNGVVHVKLDLLPFRDYASELPHLIHTANSTLVDVRLANLTESRDYNASRFALRLVLVATDDWTGSMQTDMKKSLDDEHTPGVFEIIEVKTPRCAKYGTGGYLQFRPVAYTQRERSVTTSTIVHTSDFNRTYLERSSTLFHFYREHINVELLIQDMLVSFGEPGDGYYRQHNYTSWSYTYGYGAPPVETFSLFVILVIAIGLAVPVLLALSALAYVLTRRCRQRNTPTRLVEDED